MHGKNSRASLPAIIERNQFIWAFLKYVTKPCKRWWGKNFREWKQFLTVHCIPGGWTNCRGIIHCNSSQLSTGDTQTKITFKRHSSHTSNKYPTFSLLLLAGQEFTTHKCCSSLTLQRVLGLKSSSWCHTGTGTHHSLTEQSWHQPASLELNRTWTRWPGNIPTFSFPSFSCFPSAAANMHCILLFCLCCHFFMPKHTFFLLPLIPYSLKILSSLPGFSVTPNRPSTCSAIICPPDHTSLGMAELDGEFSFSPNSPPYLLGCPQASQNREENTAPLPHPHMGCESSKFMGTEHAKPILKARTDHTLNEDTS